MRMVMCRSCGEYKQNYAKDLCGRCYNRERQRLRRESSLLDKNLLDPPVCSIKECKRYASDKPGLPMCEGHHDDYYHTPNSHFWDFHCWCGTVG